MGTVTYIDFGSTRWEESAHAAGLLAQGHIPLVARIDWPYDRPAGNGMFRRCYGLVWPDPADLDKPGFRRAFALAVIVGMPGREPQWPLRRNGSTNDDDVIAQICQQEGWDDPIEFLRLRVKADELWRSRPFRRMAVAVYTQFQQREVLDQADLQEIYDEEHACST